jgi:hypothetical protein
VGCVPAPLCKQALADATLSFPGRNRGSDGICGDQAHQARKSDHNQGNAFDLTHDPKVGCDAHLFAEQVRQQAPSWCKYIISNARISNPAGSPWRKYTGSNPHRAHAHFSIHTAARNQVVQFPWSPTVGRPTPPPPPDEVPPMQLIPSYTDGALHYFYVADGGDLWHAWWPRSEPYGRKAEDLGAKVKMGGSFDGQPSVTVDSSTSNTIHVVCDRKGSLPPAHIYYVPKLGWAAD